MTGQEKGDLLKQVTA